MAVARRCDIQAIGIDVEHSYGLERDLWQLVLTPTELRWLDAQPPEDRGELAKLVFSTKESVYKLQYPLTKTMLDFTDVHVELDLEAGRFRAAIQHGCADSLGQPLHGGFVRWQHWIWTGTIFR